MTSVKEGKLPKLKYLIQCCCVYMLAMPLSVAENAAARDFWVAPQGVVCTSTACSCGKVAPCVLTRELYAHLGPGDSVNLLPGNYPGLVVKDVHGSPDQKVIIRGVSSASGPDSSVATIRGDDTERRDALELADSSYVVLENIRVSHARRAGIRVNSSHHVEMRNSVLEHNGVWGIFTNHSNYFSAIGNTIIGPARQHGIYHSNSADHVQIVGNYIVGFDRAGVHLNGDLSMGGAPGVAGDGIISHVAIRDNFIAGNGSEGGSAINLDGVEMVSIEGNILVGNKAAGIAVFREDGGIGSRNVYARHNLLVMAPESRWAVIFNNSGSGSRFSRNIVITQDKRRGIYDVNNVSQGIRPDDELTGLPFTSDNNYFYSAGNFAVLNGVELLDFQAWQGHGQDNSSKLLDRIGLLKSSPDLDLRLPDAVISAMKDLAVAVENPYLHLLGVVPG